MPCLYNLQPFNPAGLYNHSIPPVSATIQSRRSLQPFNPVGFYNHSIPPVSTTIQSRRFLQPFNPAGLYNHSIPPVSTTIQSRWSASASAWIGDVIGDKACLVSTNVFAHDCNSFPLSTGAANWRTYAGLMGRCAGTHSHFQSILISSWRDRCSSLL